MKKTEPAKQPAAAEQIEAAQNSPEAVSSPTADMEPVATEGQVSPENDKIVGDEPEKAPEIEPAPIVTAEEPEAAIDEIEHASIDSMSEIAQEEVQHKAIGLCGKIADAARAASRSGDMQTHAVLSSIEGKLGELKHFLADKLDVVEGDIADALKGLHFHL